MVNCPKCQFNQPKDQFCANCGIDMLSYRPVQAPILSRLAKNWIVQLSSIVVVVIFGVILIRAKDRAQFAESFAALEQVTSRQHNFLSKKPIAQKVSQNVAMASAQPPTLVPLPVAQEAAAVQPPITTLAASSATSSAGTVKVADTSIDSSGVFPTKLKLVFAEITRSSLAALMGDTRNIASFGSYFSGLLPDAQDKFRSLAMPGLTVLDSASDLQIKPNQPIVVFKGSRDPQLEQNIGITTQITPTFIDEQGAHLQIEVKRTLRTPAGTAGPLIEETFQEQMVLKKDSRAYMSGLLPHRILSEEEAHSLSANPTILKVLATPEFQSSNSEFVLFIEAK